MAQIYRKMYVCYLERQEQGYWLKFCGEGKRNVLNRSFNFIVGLLESTKDWKLHSALDTKTRFLHEQKQIVVAKDLGLPVPNLVIKGRGVFVTECAGQPITQPHAVSEKERLFKAMAALIDFHNKNFIHGRPCMRDILINEQGHITYIDFEESRLSACPVMRTRDVLLFLLDSYRLKKVSQSTRFKLLEQWREYVGHGADKHLQWALKILTFNSWIPRLILRFKSNRLSRQLLLLQRLLNSNDPHHK